MTQPSPDRKALLSVAWLEAGRPAMLVGASAILLGLFIVLGTGFAQPDLLHNAAHDARHAFAFPCH